LFPFDFFCASEYTCSGTKTIAVGFEKILRYPVVYMPASHRVYYLLNEEMTLGLDFQNVRSSRLTGIDVPV
jgi:hypothetical protein